MGQREKSWEARGVHKRRRLRSSIAQRLKVVAGDVPTWFKLSSAALSERQGGGQTDEDEERTIPTGKNRRQDDGGDSLSGPTAKGKDGKGKGKGKTEENVE